MLSYYCNLKVLVRNKGVCADQSSAYVAVKLPRVLLSFRLAFRRYISPAKRLIMNLPDINNLTIHDTDPCASPVIPDDIDRASDHYMQKLKNYAKNLPYSIEPNSKMQELLDLILRRIMQCVEAKDYDPGLLRKIKLFI